jgi:hypothetical protein
MQKASFLKRYQVSLGIEMSKFTLSEDATIEINGRGVLLKKGTSLNLERSNAYVIDEDFRIGSQEGIMIVESGDIINMSPDGKYIANSSYTFRSGEQKFEIEEGDRFDIHEGWEDFVAGFQGKTKAEMASSKLQKLQRHVQRVVNKIEKILARKVRREGETEDSQKLAQIIHSEEWRTLKDIAQAASAEDIEDAIDIGGFEINDLLDDIKDALIDAGHSNTAAILDKAMPRGLLSRFGKFIKRIGGTDVERRGGSGKLTGLPVWVATDDKGNKYQVTEKDGKWYAVEIGDMLAEKHVLRKIDWEQYKGKKGKKKKRTKYGIKVGEKVVPLFLKKTEVEANEEEDIVTSEPEVEPESTPAFIDLEDKINELKEELKTAPEHQKDDIRDQIKKHEAMLKSEQEQDDSESVEEGDFTHLGPPAAASSVRK